MGSCSIPRSHQAAHQGSVVAAARAVRDSPFSGLLGLCPVGVLQLLLNLVNESDLHGRKTSGPALTQGFPSFSCMRLTISFDCRFLALIEYSFDSTWTTSPTILSYCSVTMAGNVARAHGCLVSELFPIAVLA